MTVPVRIQLAALGVVLALLGAVVAATELRIAARSWPYWPAIAAAVGCLVVAGLGVLLLRVAVRRRVATPRAARR